MNYQDLRNNKMFTEAEGIVLVTDAQEVENHLRDIAWGEEDWVKFYFHLKEHYDETWWNDWIDKTETEQNECREEWWNNLSENTQQDYLKKGLNHQNEYRKRARNRVKKDIAEIAYYFQTQPRHRVRLIKNAPIHHMIEAICGIDTNFMREKMKPGEEDFDNKYVLDKKMLQSLDSFVRIINKAYNIILGHASDQKTTSLLGEMKAGVNLDTRLHYIRNIALREITRQFSEYNVYLSVKEVI